MDHFSVLFLILLTCINLTFNSPDGWMDVSHSYTHRCVLGKNEAGPSTHLLATAASMHAAALCKTLLAVVRKCGNRREP